MHHTDVMYDALSKLFDYKLFFYSQLLFMMFNYEWINSNYCPFWQKGPWRIVSVFMDDKMNAYFDVLQVDPAFSQNYTKRNQLLGSEGGIEPLQLSLFELESNALTTRPQTLQMKATYNKIIVINKYCFLLLLK